MSEVRIEDVDRLLDEERAALLAGDLAALAGIVDRKEELLRALADGQTSRPALAALRGKAERNAELLGAASRGVRTVLRRITEIREANGPLKTYGRDGTQQTLGSTTGSLEKRA
jgi:flagellar biosynthesis/type III secretory pathway chaperone